MSRLTQLRTWLEEHWMLIAFFGFICTRLIIFFFPPSYVRYFEEYANIWYYGVPPYLKHWFEYPPATIPFISLPLLLDLAGVGIYRLNFRVMMLIVDVVLFGLVFRTIQKMKFSGEISLLSIGFYLLMTVKAKDFMLDNLDLLFALSIFFPAVAPLILPKMSEVLQWFWFWLGTGLKLVNAPLAALYWLQPGNLKKRVAILLATFCVVWAVPLVVFRSSLQVIWVYHKDRTLQVESLPALFVRGMNIFTKSETIYLSSYKSYDLKGPISDKVLPASTVLFLSSMVIFVVFCLFKRKSLVNPVFLLKMTLVFTLAYLVTNKVFSTPYHLWYLALLAVYPYRSMRERLTVFGTAGVFLFVATTRIPSINFGFANLPTILSVFLQLPAGVALFIMSIRLKTEALFLKNGKEEVLAEGEV